jgi:hypothetical protein
MEGVAADPALAGIIPQAFDHIFSAIEASAHSRQYLVRASFLEIYNEEIRDLLSKSPKDKLDIKEHRWSVCVCACACACVCVCVCVPARPPCRARVRVSTAHTPAVPPQQQRTVNPVTRHSRPTETAACTSRASMHSLSRACLRFATCSRCVGADGTRM